MSAYNIAHQISREIENSEERKAYDNARKNLEHDQGAVSMLRDFREKQIELEIKAMQGQKPSDEEIDRLRKLAEVVGMHRPLSEFLTAEMRLLQMMNDIHKIITDSFGLWDYMSEREPEEVETAE